MQYRNAKFSINGFIDCEINHPIHGWIPFTANPNDTGAQFDVAELHARMAADRSTSPYTEPAPRPPVVPRSITRRQCARQLLNLEMITGSEAVAMTRNGTPPSFVGTYFDALPQDERYIAEIDFAADSYFRDNPLLATLMAANNKTEAEVDQFFTAAAVL